MADPNSSFPYNDSPLAYDYFGLMNDPNPTLANVSADSSLGDDDLTDIPPDLLDDPMVWDNNNNNNDETTQFQEAGPSGARAAFTNDSLLVPFWPPEAAPFRCSCCQVLREIIHTDVAGNCASKLEIHGRLGMICHAILEVKDRVNVVPFASQFHMIDFCKKSIDNVKQYLQQYCNEQQRAGLVLVQDPLSMFYEAVCVGIEWEQTVNNNEEQIFQGEEIIAQQPEGLDIVTGSRSSLAQQRERAGRLTLRDLENYFHLPIEEAARSLNLCLTVVKKVCRRHGMTRWPHRKIKSYQRRISNLRELLASSNDAEERARAEAEIQMLESEIANLCTGGNN